MQLTRFDRWLQEKFVLETHIYTLRPPESIPFGIRKVEIPDNPGSRYKHLYVAKSEKSANLFLAELKANGQMYTTQIVDRQSWYVPLVAPKNKSLTWWLFSTVIIAFLVFSGMILVKNLTEDDVFRKNFFEAIQILKG